MTCGQGEHFAFDSPDAAIDAMCRRITPLDAERVPLAQASGRILAEDVRADRPCPAASVSAMDGFAVRAGDLRSASVPVVGEVRIGLSPPSLKPGTALRIVTGACIPPGCDAVLRVEDAILEGDQLAARAPLAAGDNIRHQGENLRAGECAVQAGTPITPGVVGALASFGASHPLVYRRLKLAILVTGDEVRPIDTRELPDWQLRDSNGAVLRTMFAGAPWIDVVGVRHAPDDEPLLRDSAADLLSACDALLLTGGVSMGTRDFVPGVLRDLGAEIIFHKLPQRPGKPALGAIVADTKPVFGLPGNPVSVMVTARRLAACVLAHRAGLREPSPAPLVPLAEPPKDPAPIWRFLPAAFDAHGRASIIRGKGSGDVAHAARADGFVEIPPHTTPDAARFFPWSI